MPTYKNETNNKITDQDISFDSAQTKSVDKVLVEEIITINDPTGSFIIGETVVGNDSGATGVILRYDDEDCVLDLIARDVAAFGPIAAPDATPPITGETIVGNDSGTTGELVDSKIKLTKVSDLPYFNPIVFTEISTNDGDRATVVVDVDKIKAIVFLRHTGSYTVSFNLDANAIFKLTNVIDKNLIEVNGEVQNIILTDDSGAVSTATVLQFISLEEAYRYFD